MVVKVVKLFLTASANRRLLSRRSRSNAVLRPRGNTSGGALFRASNRWTFNRLRSSLLREVETPVFAAIPAALLSTRSRRPGQQLLHPQTLRQLPEPRTEAYPVPRANPKGEPGRDLDAGARDGGTASTSRSRRIEIECMALRKSRGLIRVESTAIRAVVACRNPEPMCLGTS